MINDDTDKWLHQKQLENWKKKTYIKREIILMCNYMQQ